jgi:3-oxoacyl-[acyl-carrier-protein] synthase II
VGQITAFDTSGYKATIAAEVKDFDPEKYIERKEARRLDRYDQFFWAATQQAIEDSGIAYEEDDPASHRAGVVVGSGIGGMISFQEGVDTLRQRGPDRVSPLAITQIISNMAAGLVSIRFNLRGPNTCIVTACAASANAIGDAAELIKRNAADVMVAGGGEAPICEFAMAGFSQARALSTRNDEPERASRPFDAERDGFVMGEGAATLILEEREHALARGAKIYAEVVGYGMSADAYHVTLPRPGGGGASRAMQNAIDDAGLAPESIDYINAHGTSTQANDSTETAAIKSVFGDHARKLVVSSTKGALGHMLGAAGGVETVICVKAIETDRVPPTINLDNPDPQCDLDYVPHKARETRVDAILNNSFGFGGHNATVLARKFAG